jgi:hypothetical protein
MPMFLRDTCLGKNGDLFCEGFHYVLRTQLGINLRSQGEMPADIEICKMRCNLEPPPA